MPEIFDDQTFVNADFAGKIVSGQKYENCIFKDCGLANFDLSHISFVDCRFVNCNMGLVKIVDSSLRNVAFSSCKLIGTDFSVCSASLLDIGFEKCILDFGNFAGLKLEKTKFMECSLKEANFAGANLAHAIFDNCNLERTVFGGTNLFSADLRNSVNYSIDPEANKIKKAKFSYSGILGLLNKYDIDVS